jgi:hypothetical protein
VEEMWKIISVILLSSVKFGLGGIPLALFYQFSFFKIVVTTSIGGILGIITFSYLSDQILKLVDYLTSKWKSTHPSKPQKKFTFKNKMIVKIKTKFGLIGLAILTPTVLSMPLGMFLAKRYFHNSQRILLYMISSVLFWSIAISSFKLFF